MHYKINIKIMKIIHYIDTNNILRCYINIYFITLRYNYNTNRVRKLCRVIINSEFMQNYSDAANLNK